MEEGVGGPGDVKLARGQRWRRLAPWLGLAIGAAWPAVPAKRARQDPNNQTNPSHPGVL